MLHKTLLATALLTIFGAAQAHDADHASLYDPNVEDLSAKNEPPMLGLHLTREAHGARVGAARTRSANMTYHGGVVMPSVVTKAIFWGPSWTNSTFAGDKITGLDSWYFGHNMSNYAATVNEYTGSNGKVGSSGFAHQGHVVDTSTATAEECARFIKDRLGL